MYRDIGWLLVGITAWLVWLPLRALAMVRGPAWRPAGAGRSRPWTPV